MSGRLGNEIGRHAAVLGSLPCPAADIQNVAVKNYRLWRRNPNHPSLHFRRLRGSDERFTIRVGDRYRALGRLRSGTITWVWIGTHSEYDKLVRSD